MLGFFEKPTGTIDLILKTAYEIKINRKDGGVTIEWSDATGEFSAEGKDLTSLQKNISDGKFERTLY